MKRGLPFRELCVSLLVLNLCALLPTPVASGEAPTALGPAQAELAEAIANALSGWLPGQLQDRSVPGAAAAVVNNDTIVWQGKYGVTNGLGSPAITADTIFCIRSISKSVTSLGVLMAVQEGLVDLDTPVSEYLPDFRVHSRYDEHPEDVMTLRHMLSHWAGFTHDPPAGLNLDQPDYFERYIETIGVVVLTNRESHGLTGLEGRQIVNGPIINRYGPLPTADPELEKMQKVNIQDPRVKSILGRYGDSPGLVVGIENGVLGLRLNDTSFTAMTIYDDGGELVGFYGSTREVRLLPSRGKQPGSMMLVSRTHSNSNSHYCRSRRLTFPRMDGFKVL